MKTYLCAFLLLALLSTATCLKCNLCLDDEEICERTRIQECKPEEDTCISGVTEIFLGEKHFFSFKACIQSKKCIPGYTSTTFGNNKYSWSNIICCQTDLCNDGVIQLPLHNPTPNGLQCPACFSNTSDHCQSTETVGCTGNEDRCLAFSQSVTRGLHHHTRALQGCTTETTCTTKVGVIKIIDGWYINNITQVECSPPSEQSSTKG